MTRLSNQYISPDAGDYRGFLLPGGLHVKGKFCNKVHLRPVTGKDEEIISSLKEKENVQKIAKILLLRCIKQIGSMVNVNETVIDKMLLSDRDFIILKLRQMTFGDKIQSVIKCPNNVCGKPMDISFNLDQIPISVKPQKNQTITINLSKPFIDKNDRIHRTVKFRLPNMGDFEAISETIATDDLKANNMLLARCVKEIGDIKKINETLVSSFHSTLRTQIEDSMDKCSPEVGLELQVQCPECKHEFVSLLDIYRFLLMN